MQELRKSQNQNLRADLAWSMNSGKNVLHELRGDGVCQDGALVKGASRPASKFVDGSPRLAARVREVDGIHCFLPSLLLLLPEPR